MKTEELIRMLGTNVEPVKGGQVRIALMVALAVGVVAAICVMLAIFGVPSRLFVGEDLGAQLVALAFAVGLIGTGGAFLLKAARPGGAGQRPLKVIGLLFAVLVAAGLLALVFAHPAAWIGMAFGPQWAACLVCIPLFAVGPFASLIWALRRGAPTNLTRVGAVAGLVAGAVGAAVLAIHYPGGSIPFVVLWFGGPILLCALAGAVLGPRLLRW